MQYACRNTLINGSVTTLVYCSCSILGCDVLHQQIVDHLVEDLSNSTRVGVASGEIYDVLAILVEQVKRFDLRAVAL